MGWTPTQVRAETYGDFAAAFKGWQLSQGITGEAKGMSQDKLKEMMARYPDKAA